jgi:signal transduction histidine kinase
VLEETSVAAVLLEYKQEGLDAEAVACHIKQRFPSVPIILLSASSDRPERILWLVDEYVMKSEMAERLMPLIERAQRLAPGSSPRSPESTGSGVTEGPQMDSLSPLSLLHENGYKALVATDSSDDLRLVVAELQDKIVHVREGDLNVAVDFSSRNNEIGDLGRNFNHMVQELRERREGVEHLHCAQMSRAECLATVGELATGRAHEIRNLLAGIAGVIDVVGNDLALNSASRSAVRSLRAEIGQITRILTDLLHAARPHLPDIRLDDLNTTVEQAVILARQQVLSRPIRIEIQKEPRLPNVEHDSDQIQQVILNLLLNAIQAIDGEGAIWVEISLAKGDATITLVDTGRGIAPEHLPNIFRPFYTTKGNGTGLGLSIARRTVEDHHGRIEVASETGKGAKFLVILPLLQAFP